MGKGNVNLPVKYIYISGHQIRLNPFQTTFIFIKVVLVRIILVIGT